MLYLLTSIYRVLDYYNQHHHFFQNELEENIHELGGRLFCRVSAFRGYKFESQQYLGELQLVQRKFHELWSSAQLSLVSVLPFLKTERGEREETNLKCVLEESRKFLHKTLLSNE